MKFTVKVKIKASAKEIYNHWLSSEGHTKMTGGAAEITNVIGDRFTAWDGYIEGKNLELEPNRRILQAWRTSQFLPHEADSHIEILLEETGGQTEITLIHSNLPESGGHYEQGWDNHYFQPMKTYFS